jgi:hypothetical protein
MTMAVPTKSDYPDVPCDVLPVPLFRFGEKVAFPNSTHDGVRMGEIRGVVVSLMETNTYAVTFKPRVEYMIRAPANDYRAETVTEVTSVEEPLVGRTLDEAWTKLTVHLKQLHKQGRTYEGR